MGVVFWGKPKGTPVLLVGSLEKRHPFGTPRPSYAFRAGHGQVWMRGATKLKGKALEPINPPFHMKPLKPGKTSHHWGFFWHDRGEPRSSEAVKPEDPEVEVRAGRMRRL